MYAQFQHNVEEKPVDNEQSYRWLKEETESTIVAAQDQAIIQIILKINV